MNFSKVNSFSWPLFLGVIGVIAFSLRLKGLFGDFWLDEVWSLNNVLELKSIIGIFTLHIDNNHWLNSLYLYLVGKQSNWAIYRLFSFITGSLAVVITSLVSKHVFGFLAGIFTGLLMAFSFVLIEYSTEARGYGPLLLFTVISFWSLRECLADPTSRTKTNKYHVFFACSSILSLLSHLSFLYIYISFFIWSAYDFIQHFHPLTKTSPKKLFPLLIQLIKLHTPFGIFFSFLYWIDIRQMNIGGGDPSSTQKALTDLFFNAFGIPDKGFILIALLIYIFISIIYLVELFDLKRKNRSEWVFFLFALSLSPLISASLNQTDMIFARYFLVITPFFFMLVGSFLSRCFRINLESRVLVIFLLFFFCWGNLLKTIPYFKQGQGQCLAMMKYMEQESSSPITYLTDHPFRHKLLMEYYSRYLLQKKTFSPLNGIDWKHPPTWMIFHSQKQTNINLKQILLFESKNRPFSYSLMNAYLSNALS